MEKKKYLGEECYLAKPITLDMLLDVAKEVCDGKYLKPQIILKQEDIQRLNEILAEDFKQQYNDTENKKLHHS